MLAGLVLVMSACSGSDGPLGLGSPSTDAGPAATTATLAPATTVAPADTSAAATDTTPAAPAGGGEASTALQADCAAGDYARCDILWLSSDPGSAAEAFGATCGDRVAADGGSCVDQFGVVISLDDLRPACADGDMVACDQLFLYSDFDSTDEAFGASCGGRIETDIACVSELGLFAG